MIELTFKEKKTYILMSIDATLVAAKDVPKIYEGLKATYDEINNSESEGFIDRVFTDIVRAAVDAANHFDIVEGVGNHLNDILHESGF